MTSCSMATLLVARRVPVQSSNTEITVVLPSLPTSRFIRLHGQFARLVLIMKHRIAGLASLSRVSTCSPSLCTTSLARRLPRVTQQYAVAPRYVQLRSLTITSSLKREASTSNDFDSNARPAADLNNNITQEEKDHFAKKLAEDKGKQIRTPWHREGSDVPPVARQRSAGAMTKGTSSVTTQRVTLI
jgi:hypothetical protein